VSLLDASRGAWHGEKRKEVEASVPARIKEPRLGCSHVDETLQKSVGGVWSRIRSAYALQKERSGSSERGPSSERMSAGDTVVRRLERKDEPRVGLTAHDGRGPAKAQGVERSSSSGRNIAKSGVAVVGPGL
jgi:hypothetical protein